MHLGQRESQEPRRLWCGHWLVLVYKRHALYFTVSHVHAKLGCYQGRKQPPSPGPPPHSGRYASHARQADRASIPPTSAPCAAVQNGTHLEFVICNSSTNQSDVSAVHANTSCTSRTSCTSARPSSRTPAVVRKFSERRGRARKNYKKKLPLHFLALQSSLYIASPRLAALGPSSSFLLLHLLHDR